MKVTFMVYRYNTNSIDLVQAVVGKNNPTKEQWDEAAKIAKEKVGGDVAITAVLRGLVVYESEAPDDFSPNDLIAMPASATHGFTTTKNRRIDNGLSLEPPCS